MATPKALQQPFSLRFASASFLAFWCLIAAFPIFWIAVMSFKSPVDAFSANPLDVIFGPTTRAGGDGLSILDIAIGLAVLIAAVRLAFTRLPKWVDRLSPQGMTVIGISDSPASPIISICARMPRPRCSTTMRRQAPVKPKDP